MVQLPSMQVGAAHSLVVPGQAMPQEPQFAGSVANDAGSTQTLLQQVPLKQSVASSQGASLTTGPAWQTPATQVSEQQSAFCTQSASVAPQHGPQSTGWPQLLVFSPHPEPHVTESGSRVQQPESVQTWFAEQQTPRQTATTGTQMPSQQTAPVAQARPHDPQFAGSDWNASAGSTQRWPHACCPAGQTQRRRPVRSAGPQSRLSQSLEFRQTLPSPREGAAEVVL